MDYGDPAGLLVMMIPIVAIAGFFLVVALRISSAARVRELEIRQRIAMIEKGLVPPPEVDPGRFEETLHVRGLFDRRPSRHRSAGITFMGIGFGLMFLIGVAGGAPDQGVGVGGFVVIVGLAFFVNSLFEHRYDQTAPPPSSASTAPTPSSSSDPNYPPR
jgi:hypothetical protein